MLAQPRQALTARDHSLAITGGYPLASTAVPRHIQGGLKHQVQPC